MKQNLISIAIILLGNISFTNAANFVVGVTIPPQQEPVQAVMGTNVVVKVLMDGNQNPHFFCPSAKRLVALAECDLYFTIGFPGEKNVENKFASIGKPKLVQMLESISEHRHHHHGHKHNNCGGTTDIHYWTSPLKLKEMAKTVCAEAIKLMPEEEAYFKQNLTAYEAQCDKVLEEGKEVLKSAGVTHIFTYHPALGNYASAMGITQLAIEKDGREPTLGVVANVVTGARKHKVKKLFVQNSGEAQSSKVILNHLDVSLVIIKLLSSEPLALIQQITEELGN